MKDLTIHILSIECCRLVSSILENSKANSNAVGYCYNISNSIDEAKLKSKPKEIRDKQICYNDKDNNPIFPYQISSQITEYSTAYLIASPFQIAPIELINNVMKMLPMYTIDILQTQHNLIIININKRLKIEFSHLEEENNTTKIELIQKK